MPVLTGYLTQIVKKESGDNVYLSLDVEGERVGVNDNQASLALPLVGKRVSVVYQCNLQQSAAGKWYNRRQVHSVFEVP